MKKYMPYIFLSILILLFSNCETEDNSHYYIRVKNLSETDVYLTLRGTYLLESYNYCMMGYKATIKKDSVFNYRPYRGRIEQRLRGGATLEFYIVNPDHFNAAHEFYDCDSLAIKNDILQHYKLTLEDLQRMDWTVVYRSVGE